MELRDFLAIVRKRWVAIVAITLAGGVLAGVFSALQTPQFTATTQLYVSVQTDASVGQLSQGATFSQQQVASYVQFVSSPKVLGPVVDDLGLATTPEALAGRVTATSPTDTSLINVAVTDPSAASAAAIANAVGKQLGSEIRDLETLSTDAPPRVKATVVRDATAPSSPSSPNTRLNVILGVLLGVVAGLAWAALRETLDTRVRTEESIARVTDAPVIGAIVYDKQADQHPLVIESSPHSPRAEAFRRVRTNLQFLDVADPPRTIVVTSSLPGEGKSTTAINLAITLAAAGTDVALVDADLRRPMVAPYMGLEGAVGLTTVLIGRAELADVLQPWGNGRLHVLASGQIPPNPSELLGSHAMKQLLDELLRDHEVVILDSPPLLPVTDAAILAKLAGGALVVVGAGLVHRPQLRDALNALDTVGARTLGLVINRRKASDDGYYYGTYEYAGRRTPEHREIRTLDHQQGSRVVAQGVPSPPTVPRDDADLWPGEAYTDTTLGEVRRRRETPPPVDQRRV